MSGSYPLVLEVSGFGCSYPDRPEVLSDVNLRVAGGARVGLIGPNGAGKTSLFLALCGVLKPDAGSIRLFGEAVTPGRFRSDVGMVFQNPDDQLFCPSVADDVAFGPRNLGLSEDEVTQRVDQALTATGVSSLAHYAPHHLSGGEKRMVSIAAVLAMRPRLVVYDEPTANLDIRSRRRLIRFLQQTDETLLVASHDLEFILEICHRTILLDGGRIIADDDSRVLMSNEPLMEAHGLERPHSLVPHAKPHPHLHRVG